MAVWAGSKHGRPECKTASHEGSPLRWSNSPLGRSALGELACGNSAQKRETDKGKGRGFRDARGREFA